MWHVYNLIAVSDSVRASTFRKVTTEGATGSSRSQKIRLTLTLEVVDIYFDTEACALRIKGRNIEENEHVKLGAYHTIDLETNRKFTLSKNEWDTVSIERVELATDPAKSADVAAIGTYTVWKFKYFHGIQILREIVSSNARRLSQCDVNFWKLDFEPS